MTFFFFLYSVSFLLSSFLWTTLCLSAFSTTSIFRLWLPSHSHPLSLSICLCIHLSPDQQFSAHYLLRLFFLSTPPSSQIVILNFFCSVQFFFHFLSVNGSYCIFITLLYSCFLLPPSAFTQCWFFSSCSPPLTFHSIFHILLFFLPSHFVSLSLSSRHFHSLFLCSGTFAKCSLSLQFLSSFLSFQHLSAFFALSFGVSLPFHIFISDVFITCTVYRWIVYWKNYKCTLELMTATILWATNSLVYDITTWTFLLGVGDKTKRKQHI